VLFSSSGGTPNDTVKYQRVNYFPDSLIRMLRNLTLRVAGETPLQVIYMWIHASYFFSDGGMTESSTCFLYSAKSMGEQRNSGIS
jgi:hypothetical protein